MGTLRIEILLGMKSTKPAMASHSLGTKSAFSHIGHREGRMRRLNEAIIVSEVADVKLTEARSKKGVGAAAVLLSTRKWQTKVTFPVDYPFLAATGLC